MLNTSAGSLLIGVNDSGEIVGIEHDFRTLSKKPNLDGWRLAFAEAVSRDVGVDAVACFSVGMVEVGGRTVAEVKCKKRDGPTWHAGTSS